MLFYVDPRVNSLGHLSYKFCRAFLCPEQSSIYSCVDNRLDAVDVYEERIGPIVVAVNNDTLRSINEGRNPF